MSGSYLDDDGNYIPANIDSITHAQEIIERLQSLNHEFADRLIELEEIRKDEDLINDYYWVASGEEVGL